MISFPPRRIRSALMAHGRRPAGTACRLQSQYFLRAEILVSLFYLLQFGLLPDFIRQWPSWRQAASLAPVGVTAWIPALGIRHSVDLILAAYVAALVLACVAPRVRLFRILVLITLLLAAGLSNSFGKINHGYHCWLYASLALVFLPSGSCPTGSAARLFKQKFLTAVLGAQALVLGSYTLSGLWKVAGTVAQVLSHQKSYLSLDGMAYQVAHRLLQDGTTTVLGPLVIENPWLGWFPALAAIYVELFALAVVFRPALHRTWAFLLIGMHLGAGLVIGIAFTSNVLLVALLFGASPFALRPASLSRRLSCMPLFGWAAARQMDWRHCS